MLRIPAALHARLKRAAEGRGISLNRLCGELLAKGLKGSGGGVAYPGAEVAGINVRKIVAEWAGLVEGVILFGSVARADAWDTSDVDLLLVLKSGSPVTRDLYRRWEEGEASAPGDRKVSMMLAALPESLSKAGSLWYEAAVDGIVLWDTALRISGVLAGLRRQMAEGRLVRGYAHGQPYWVKKDESA